MVLSYFKMQIWQWVKNDLEEGTKQGDKIIQEFIQQEKIRYQSVTY